MKRLILLLVLTTNTWAAIAAGTVWELRTAGADTNGGGYSTGGTDMSQFDNKNAAACTSCQSATVNISVTNGVTAGTTTITSATANFSSALIGNVINVSGGTGSVTSGWYQVASVTNSTTIVVDRSTGLTAGTGVTINIGGALLSLGRVASVFVNQNIAYFLNTGTFSVTSASTNVTGGVCGASTGGLFFGYGTHRTPFNTDTPATIQINVASATIFQCSHILVNNFILDGNAQTSAKLTTGGVFSNDTFENFRAATSGTVRFFNVYATGNSVNVLTSGQVCIFCFAKANTATQFGPNDCVFCFGVANTGATTDGYTGSLTQDGICAFCTMAGNGRDGFRATGSGVGTFCFNCYAESNTSGIGFNLTQTNASARAIDGFGYYNNMTTTSFGTGVGTTTAITPASTVFASGSNYNLNNTTNAGALLRNVGIPNIFLDGNTTIYLDINGTRHQDLTLPQLSITIGTGFAQ